MSTIKERATKLLETLEKKLGFADETPSDSPVDAAQEYTLADGKKIYITELKEGGIVSTMAADGSQTPVPAGDYALADNTVVTVGESGAISAVKSPEQEAPPTAEQSAETMRAAIQKFATGTPEERLANLETVAKALMNYPFGWEMRRTEEEQSRNAAITAYQTMSSQEKDNAKELKMLRAAFKAQQETIKEMAEIIQEVATAPGAEPVDEENKKSHFAEQREKKNGTLNRRLAAMGK